MKMKDDKRRQLIVSRARPTKRDPRGKLLELKFSVHDKGMFIRTRGVTKDISCSSRDVVVAEFTKLLDLLICEQRATS